MSRNFDDKFGNPKKYRKLVITSLTFITSLLALDALIRSIQVSIPVAIIFSFIPALCFKREAESQRRKFEKLWPEILDQIISGIQSGLSLSQTLASLSQRGPQRVQPNFQRFTENVKSGNSFDSAISQLKTEFSHPLSDQVCEVLRIAHAAGSRDTTLTLRTYAEFVTSDLALNEEIRAKHSWIRNSALLASITPWILLVLLSTQDNARQAYSSSSGFTVLLSGVVLTVTAYFWMDKVGIIPIAPRVFSR
jgi:tight adherence protein B